MRNLEGLELLGRAPETCPARKKFCGAGLPPVLLRAPQATRERVELGAGFRMRVAADLAMRERAFRLAEVTRLAIGAAYAGAKTLLVQLFNSISVYARRVEKSTDFIIEVNPRHVNYYRRLLLFEPAGPERPCPRVNGAPAVLLRLDLAAQAAEIGSVGGTQGQARGPHGRTLYSHFCTLAQEQWMVDVLVDVRSLNFSPLHTRAPG